VALKLSKEILLTEVNPNVGRNKLYFKIKPLCPLTIPVSPKNRILVSASEVPLGTSNQLAPPLVVFRIFPVTPTQNAIF
jgi:hypothetical protein